MSIICISRGGYGYGQELAEKLASKMDATCLSREQITDEATNFGIPVGKLEMTVLKHRPLSEAMGIARDMFKAFVAAYISERVLDGSVVYHGRTGHLVLPDLKSVLRVRTIEDMEARINRIMTRLRLSREKAKTYATQVDEDRKRWVRRIYNVDWDDPSLYDVVLNAAHLSSENAASVLVEMSQLAEFQITPASFRILQDILLSSRCRLAIGSADATRNMSVTVQANKGFVSATYPPHQADQAGKIPSVLEKIDGIKSLVCTLATTNILYIGDHFDPKTPDFNHLVEIAEKWNAAVDLAQIRESVGTDTELDESPPAPESVEEAAYNGGILPETDEVDDVENAGKGVPETMDYLIQVGRAGRFRSFKGGATAVISGFAQMADYSLVVVGDVFTDRQRISQRLKRNFIGLLSEKFRVPVIGSEELKSQYLFGSRQLVVLIFSLAISLFIYLAVFSHQERILNFISAGHFSKGSLSRVMAAVAVALLVPLVAFSVGSFYKNILKLIKLE